MRRAQGPLEHWLAGLRELPTPKNIGWIINKGAKHEPNLKTVERIFS